MEDVVSLLNLNADEQFVLVECSKGSIGLNPRLVTLIKDITSFSPSKDLKCSVNVDAEKIAERIKDILRKEFNYLEALGN